MEKSLNLANSIFAGFNDKNGLMICGYEWGEESQSKGQEVIIDMTKECTFSNKSLRYGDVAKTWIKYDKRIRTWFSMWGHPLNEEGEPYRVCRRVNILRDYSDEKTKLYPRN